MNETACFTSFCLLDFFLAERKKNFFYQKFAKKNVLLQFYLLRLLLLPFRPATATTKKKQLFQTKITFLFACCFPDSASRIIYGLFWSWQKKMLCRCESALRMFRDSSTSAHKNVSRSVQQIAFGSINFSLGRDHCCGMGT